MTEIRYPREAIKMSTDGWRKSRFRESYESIDDVDDDEVNWPNAHLIVVSRAHHLRNVEASNELLKLLNFYHGPDKGFTIEVIG